jgi:tRNA(adenine34) deaminase
MFSMNKYMAAAIKEALAAENEVPVGAVIVKNGGIIAGAANSMFRDNNATKHAEINAVNAALARLNETYLSDCDIYVTKEPCLMCFGALINARIRRVYFGAYDVKYGACEYVLPLLNAGKSNHCPEIYGGIMENECRAILEGFFGGNAQRRGVSS